jgi:hypothetical protein
MLSLEESKKILNAGDRKYTDEEVKQIRDYIYTVARIQVDMENGKMSQNNEDERVK